MSAATDILRVRAAIRRRVSSHPDTLAMAGEIEALANLLDEIRRCYWSDPQPCDHEEAGDCADAIDAAANALEQAITDTESRST